MKLRRVVAIAVVTVFAFGLGAEAAGALPHDDGTGKEWRQLYETTGLSWNQVASVCPTDGATPCTGTVGGKNLTGWVWATDTQVIAFMGQYAPALLTASPPSVGGPEYMLPAAGFLGAMRWTTYTALTYFYYEFTGGWTASTSAAGLPLAGGASFTHPFFNGSLGVGEIASADEAGSVRGVFLWRAAGGDVTAPLITPTVTGTLGNNGWYTSNVDVSWSVTDDESAIVDQTGCESSTVSTDTATVTFPCSATSTGGTSSASVTVKRDATPPTLACNATPTFTLGSFGQVTGTATDATSGLAGPSFANANTSTTGSFTAVLSAVDRAGNPTTRTCPYTVAVPPCGGLTPTIVGTNGNDVINGTGGADVIAGLGGNDKIYGKSGSDVICGDAGNDEIEGGGGNDKLYGGDGTADSIRGDGGKDTCSSGEKRMSSCETII